MSSFENDNRITTTTTDISSSSSENEESENTEGKKEYLSGTVKFRLGQEPQEQPLNIGVGSSEGGELQQQQQSPELIERDEAEELGYLTQLSGNNATLEGPPTIDFYQQFTITAQSGDSGGERSNGSVRRSRSRPSMPQLMHGSRDTLTSQSIGGTSRQRTTSTSADDNAIVVTGSGGAPSDKLPQRSFEQKTGKQRRGPKPLGVIEGVFIPAFTNIVGTLLYLRIGYVAGQAGILMGLAVVLFSSLVVGLTALSVSAICSNGRHRKGGVYFVVSRALGPQFGGVIAVVFSLANVAQAALYIIGVAEFLSDLLSEQGFPLITPKRLDDIRLFSLAISVIIMMITFAGPNIENSFTWLFFITYFVSYANWLVGTLLPVTEEKWLKGVTGYSVTTLRMNLLPDYRTGESLITVFSVFFPGFTGILAGTMYVDQLQNPSSDVATGLFTALGTTTVMYSVAVIACGSTMLRDASGMEVPTVSNVTGLWTVPDCALTGSCRYGLINFYQFAELTSAWRPLIIAGMFAMTISSTMTNLDQGPLNFQAACKDSVLPYLSYFGKEHGVNKWPRRAYLLLALCTTALTTVGDLNQLNGITTNLFMATYALCNYACFEASFVRSPGWRPEFKGYNMWVSLFAATLCIAIMFIVSVDSSIIICVMFAACLAYFHYFHPEVNWGDSNQAHIYRNALTNLLKLSGTELHVKNYRPQILLLTGNPIHRPRLLEFTHSITKGESLLVCAHVVPLEAQMEVWIRKNRVKAFYENIANEHLRTGVAHLLQTVGLGKFRPNILVMGYKRDWAEKAAFEVDDYVGIIRDAFENSYGVGILCNQTESSTFAMLKNQPTEVVPAQNDSRRSTLEADGKEQMNNENTETTTLGSSNVKGVPVSLRFPLQQSSSLDSELGQKTLPSSAQSTVSRGTVIGRFMVRAAAAGGSKISRMGSKKKRRPSISTALAVVQPIGTTTPATSRISRLFTMDEVSAASVEEVRETAGALEGKVGTEAEGSISDSLASFQHPTLNIHRSRSELTLNLVDSIAQRMRLKRLEVYFCPEWYTDNVEVYREIAAVQRASSPYAARQIDASDQDQHPPPSSSAIPSGTKRPKRIDVWWLYDDGGLTLLIPHLLRSHKSHFEGAELRILTLAGDDQLDESSMVALLSKFRIKFSAVKVIDFAREKLRPEILSEFSRCLKPWRRSDDFYAPDDKRKVFVTETELREFAKRTQRQLLTRQLLLEHSADAELIVLTLPVPRESLSSCLYMCWLEMLCRGLPLTFLVRGNQTSVLTFYS